LPRAVAGDRRTDLPHATTGACPIADTASTAGRAASATDRRRSVPNRRGPLAARDTAAAERALARLVTEYASSPLVEQALYERARIAYQQRAWATARRHLDRLLALPATRLAEPGQYLACRIAVEARDGEAAACLVAYRKAHPRSPHDHDVPGMLVQLDHAAGGCRGCAAGWPSSPGRIHAASSRSRGVCAVRRRGEQVARRACRRPALGLALGVAACERIVDLTPGDPDAPPGNLDTGTPDDAVPGDAGITDGFDSNVEDAPISPDAA
jgi:hypothetical protein